MPYTRQRTGYAPTDTSHNAARDIEPKVKTLRDQVLAFLRERTFPATTEVIASALGRPYASIQPRLSELKEKGLVEDSGRRGRTQYGKPCIEWRCTERGQ